MNFIKNLSSINSKNKTLSLLIFVFILLIGVFLYQLRSKNTPAASIVKPVLTKYDIESKKCKEEISQKNPDTKLAEFNDYKITSEYSGPLADPDINSHFLARRFRTMIRNDVRGYGINFAGHYTIAQWGATGVGYFIAAVDRITGKVYPFPYVIKTGLRFQKDSNLLIINPLDDMLAYPYPCWEEMANIRTFYFNFDGEKFVLIGPKDKPGPDSESYGWLDY